MSDMQAQRPPCRPRFTPRELFWAWLMATVFSGLPSTTYALLIDADPLEATWAAGAMLLSTGAPPAQLFMAAAVVHGSVSALWTVVFGTVLPRRRVVFWALAGSAAVALLDLRLIAPALFPSVAGLALWPQFADHLMWGALLGGTLAWRQARPGAT